MFDGTATFMNIQAGTYTLTARAPYHKDIQITLKYRLLLTWNLCLCKWKRYLYSGHDYRTLNETQSAIVSGGDYEDVVLRASMPAAQAITWLSGKLPGSEFWYLSTI